MQILLIDTCGEGASIALADDATLLGIASMPARAGSAMLVDALKGLLEESNSTLQQLQAVGVVTGPGSFTGVRVGLSCAKGLCEARNIPLATVSRLQVLASASGLQEGYAALNAGRGEIFVLDVSRKQESLRTIEEVAAVSANSRIVVCEQPLLHTIGRPDVELHEMDASASLSLVLEKLSKGGDDVGTADANYLRGEQQIYGSKRNMKDAEA